jgi:CheY-like chemotaxis protein
VLVADDDHDTVLTLMALLRYEGHETRGVYHGADVVEAVREFEPDAVLLDIGMPGKSGYEIARELRELYGAKAPLLIAVTAHNKGSDKLLAQLVGFDHHVGKPYDSQHILALLAARTIGR